MAVDRLRLAQSRRAIAAEVTGRLDELREHVFALLGELVNEIVARQAKTGDALRAELTIVKTQVERLRGELALARAQLERSASTEFDDTSRGGALAAIKH